MYYISVMQMKLTMKEKNSRFIDYKEPMTTRIISSGLLLCFQKIIDITPKIKTALIHTYHHEE